MRIMDLEGTAMHHMQEANGAQPVNRREASLYPARPRIVERSDSRDWIDQAACNGMDPELFFPEDLQTRSRRDQESARQIQTQALLICAGCPVRQRCLEYGMNDEYGIFGGMTATQRELLRAKRDQYKRRTP